VPRRGRLPLVTHRHARLGGEHDVVAPACDGLADHLFRLAGAVPVGGVDEVDSALERGVDDGDGLVLGRAPDGAEVHRAEHKRAHLHAGAAQGAVLHDVSPPSGGLRGRAGTRHRVGNLCVSADGDSRYDARRMAGLLIAGLRQSRPISNLGDTP
jgi:hypothetical protein